MTPSEKQSFWKRRIEGWQKSGLSQKKYCAEKGISFSSFGYWRKRFSKPGKLIPVAAGRSIEKAVMYPPNGIRIEVPLNALTQVLATLEELDRYVAAK